MSVRGRSPSPRPINGSDTEMAVDQPMKNGHHGSRSRSREKSPSGGDTGPRVVVVQNLTRNVLESHVRVIFGHYGKIKKVDFPTYRKTGQTRGKAAMEYFESKDAAKAVKHMDGGQLDGAVLQLARLVVDRLPLHLFATWAGSVLTLCPVLDPAPEVVHPSGGAGRGQGLCRPVALELAALPDVGRTALVPAVDVVDSTGATTAADIEEDAAGTATDTAHPDVVEEGASQNLAHAPHLDAPVVGLLATNVVAGGHRAEAVPAAVLQVAVGLVVDRTPGHDLAPTLGDRILPIPEDALPEAGVAQGVEARLPERGFALAAES
ncbi:hypothetical protein FRC05_000245 [Tulasnella sp. 425]|nr:hypothetical protein FRC05_000245 [Tulasnella sp. 425]